MAIEDQIAVMLSGNEGASLPMSIPRINVYSAAFIIAEIDDVQIRIQGEACILCRPYHQAWRPSLLRFILVNAVHLVIRYSKSMRLKYLSIVMRLGKNRSIVAIARHLLGIIYTMLTKRVLFMDNIDSLTERKMAAMSIRSRKPKMIQELEESVTMALLSSFEIYCGPLSVLSTRPSGTVPLNARRTAFSTDRMASLAMQDRE